MASLPQIRGALLEEAVLRSLRRSGFQTIERATGDDTLEESRGALWVKGRGEIHQADAIADFRVGMPFGHPNRLIVEAKCYEHTRTGLATVRNAVGVVKDVSEFFVPSRRPRVPDFKRYHYQYAIFSATPFTETAQRYAFAQDISLVVLQRDPRMARVIDAIRRIRHTDFGVPSETDIPLRQAEFRRGVRSFLRNELVLSSWSTSLHDNLLSLREALDDMGGALLGVANRRLLLYLTPVDRSVLNRVAQGGRIPVQVHFDEERWYLREGANDLFTFDLPPELFELYAETGILSPASALELKQAELGQIDAIYSDEESFQLVTFALDPGWVQSVRSQIAGRSR